MRPARIPLYALAVFTLGCQGEPARLGMATTPEQARAALVAGLDAWKAGGAQKDLAGRSPPIYLADDDLVRGRKLIDYKPEGEPAVVGIGLTFTVAVTVQDGDKPPQTKKRLYRVVTSPQIAITKEDGSP